MNIEMKYHSRQHKEQIALKERLSIAMGVAHRNDAKTKYRALKGRYTDFALSGLRLYEPCRDRALPYPDAYKAFSLNLTFDSHNF